MPAAASDTGFVLGSSYGQIEGYETLKTLGTQVLGLALAVHIAYQIYRLIHSGEADFLGPIVKIGVATILINYLVPMGDFIGQSMDFLSGKVFDQNLAATTTKAWAIAYKGVSDPGMMEHLSVIFSTSGLTAIAINLTLMFVLVVKMMIIDAAWPAILGLVVLGGLIAIPIGVFPGMNTFRGWVLSLVEVSIWPLTFHLCTTLMFGMMHGHLKDVEKLEGVWGAVEQIEELESKREGWFTSESEKTEINQNINKQLLLLYEKHGVNRDTIDSAVWVLIKFLAIALCYLGFAIATPKLSRMIVRGESASAAGTALAAGAAVMALAVISRSPVKTGEMGQGLYDFVSKYKEGRREKIAGSKKSESKDGKEGDKSMDKRD